MSHTHTHWSIANRIGFVIAGLFGLANIPSALFPPPAGEVGPPLPILVADTIVADFATAESAIAALKTLEADVVLMDLNLGGLRGIEATRRIRQRDPRIKVLVLSMLDDPATVLTAIEAGANGYLVKSSRFEEILRGIHAVHSGQTLLGSGIGEHMIRRTRTGGVPPPMSKFSTREQQLLGLLAHGKTTSQMAARLGITPKTVRNYLSNLYLKLSVADRGQAALAARNWINQ